MRKTNDFLLRFRDRDTQAGVTRVTLSLLSEKLGLSETDVIHKSLVTLAMNQLPQYEPDNGPPTEADRNKIKSIVTGKHGNASMVESLFPDMADSREPKLAQSKRVRPSPRTR